MLPRFFLFAVYILCLVMGYFAVELGNHVLAAVAIGIAFCVGQEA